MQKSSNASERSASHRAATQKKGQMMRTPGRGPTRLTWCSGLVLCGLLQAPVLASPSLGSGPGTFVVEENNPEFLSVVVIDNEGVDQSDVTTIFTTSGPWDVRIDVTEMDGGLFDDDEIAVNIFSVRHVGPSHGEGPGVVMTDSVTIDGDGMADGDYFFPLVKKVAHGLHVDGWLSTAGVKVHIQDEAIDFYYVSLSAVHQLWEGEGYCFGDGSGVPCPCGATGSLEAGCRNSAGLSAKLTGTGEACFSNDTLHLSVQGLPGNQPGILIRGDNQVSFPAGDGILCLTGNVQRSGVGFGGSFGGFGSGTGLGSVANLAAPTNFQYWYRDPANPCTGSGFNFSNAWTVTYLP
jgi:hypothetical protein